MLGEKKHPLFKYIMLKLFVHDVFYPIEVNIKIWKKYMQNLLNDNGYVQLHCNA